MSTFLRTTPGVDWVIYWYTPGENPIQRDYLTSPQKEPMNNTDPNLPIDENTEPLTSFDVATALSKKGAKKTRVVDLPTFQNFVLPLKTQQTLQDLV